MLICTLVSEGQRIPWGWGIAYRDFERDAKLAYPIPIHFLVRWARDLRFWLMTVGRPGYREKVESEFFRRGLDEGQRREHALAEYDRLRQYERGWKACADHLLESFDAKFGKRDSNAT